MHGDVSPLHTLLDDGEHACDVREARARYIDVFVRAAPWRNLPVELRRALFVRYLRPCARYSPMRAREAVLATICRRLRISADDLARMRARAPALFHAMLHRADGLQAHYVALERLHRAHYILCRSPAFNACRARLHAFGDPNADARAFSQVATALENVAFALPAADSEDVFDVATLAAAAAATIALL